MADNNQGMPANLLDEGQSYIQETSTTAPTILLSEPSSTSGINPLVPAIVGAGAGVAAPIPRHIAENLANIRAKQIESNAPPSASGGAGAPSPGAKYSAKTGYGVGPGYTVEEVVEAHKGQNKPIGSGKISGKIGRNTPMNIDAMQALEQQKLEENARRAATLKMEAEAAMSPLQRGTAKIVEKTIPTKLQNIAGAVDEAFVPASKQWWARGVRGTGRGIQGGMGVAQTIDAINKGSEGDVPGAVMSGIGAAGNLATFIPSPITRVGGTIVGGLPFAGNMIGSANAEPLDVPGTTFDVATGLMGAPGLMLSPSPLGEATIHPKNKAYRPGMTGILHGTRLPPEGHAEGGDIKKPSAGIAGVYQQVGPVKGPSLSSIFSEHIASLPQKTEANLRQQQDIMDRAFAGDREAMKEFTNMVAGVGGMIKPTSLAELMELIKQRGGIEAAKRLEKAADLVPNLEHQYQPQALKEAFTGNRSIVSVMNPADFEKYAAPISSETKSSLSKSRRIGEPGPGQDYTHMPLGTYDDYINYLQQFSAPGGGGFRSMPYLQLGQRKGFSFPNIQGHEGRHRTDALARQGNQSTLIGIDPRPELRELPRSSQEEYLNALASEVGGRNPFVTPQQSEVKRGLIELPEMFKKGGLV